MNTKQQPLFVMFGVVIVTLACSLVSGIPVPTQTTQPQGNPADEVATAVAATMQSLTAVSVQNTPTQAEAPTQQPAGIPVSLQHVSFIIPNTLAGGAMPEPVAAVGQDSGAPWEVAPAHLKFTMTGYQLQGKFHEPSIFVYPADEFAQVHSGAAEQIERLKSALAGSILLKETLPIVPFFNAGPLIAANIQLMKFQNGGGVRTLTQYAQYSGPINNHELFYHFQGLTSDGKYYVIAILPITAPILAEDEKTEAPVPEGGVPIPADIGPNTVYYISVTEKLNSLPPDSYIPSLSALDALIQSILVTNT